MERILEPGVYVNEKELLPQQTGTLTSNSVFIGFTKKGRAFVPTVVNSYREFMNLFGGTSPKHLVSYAVKMFLRNSNSACIVRVLPDEGYVKSAIALYNPLTNRLLATLTKSRINDGLGEIDSVSIVSTSNPNDPTEFNLNVTYLEGSQTTTRTYTLSLQKNRNYIGKKFDKTPSFKDLYVFTLFDSEISSAASAITSSSPSNPVLIADVLAAVVFNLDYRTGQNEFGRVRDYHNASTPFVIDQYGNKMFRFRTFSDGDDSNKLYKIEIANVVKVPDSKLSTFDVLVRDFNDTDDKPIYIEQFRNCSLDPENPNFILRAIGNKTQTYNPVTKMIEEKGVFSSKSKHIYIETSEEFSSLPIDSVPVGFETLLFPYSVRVNSNLVGVAPLTYKTSIVTGSSQNPKVNLRHCYGFDFSNESNHNFLVAHTSQSLYPSGFSNFSLLNLSQTERQTVLQTTQTVTDDQLLEIATGRGLAMKKFVLPFYGGFDGFFSNPSDMLVGNEETLSPSYLNGSNLFGMDVRNENSSGTIAFRKAIDVISNPDVILMKEVYVPGVILGIHSEITSYLIALAEQRKDFCLILDAAHKDMTPEQCVENVSGVESSFTACYYDWSVIVDDENNVLVEVPPTVMVAYAISLNDRIGYEWNAPAGLNRARLPLISCKRLTREQRAYLYDNRVNPFRSFPDGSYAVWGQKTLAAKTINTALNRLNVRRMVLNIKRFVNDNVRFLVFENNTAALRNSFITLITPYLEFVQKNNGLNGFLVVMDESINTPDVVDRNMLKGEIYIKPAKTAEFIVIDFVLTPTGFEFPA